MRTFSHVVITLLLIQAMSAGADSVISPPAVTAVDRTQSTSGEVSYEALGTKGYEAICGIDTGPGQKRAIGHAYILDGGYPRVSRPYITFHSDQDGMLGFAASSPKKAGFYYGLLATITADHYGVTMTLTDPADASYHKTCFGKWHDRGTNQIRHY